MTIKQLRLRAAAREALSALELMAVEPTHPELLAKLNKALGSLRAAFGEAGA